MDERKREPVVPMVSEESLTAGIEPQPEQLLAEARLGRRESLGLLLERYRLRLLALARTQFHRRLQARANPSDLVQETFLQASRRFNQFRGTSEKEWLGWLGRILRRRVLRLVRRHLVAGKRSVRRELSLQSSQTKSSAGSTSVGTFLVSSQSSPSAAAQRRELAELMAQRLGRLPDAYREVLVLRHLQGFAFPEVARRMGRSEGAVRILWLRALTRLRQERLAEDLL